MATGLVDNWLNVDQFGAIYPFVGTEGLLAFAGIAFWVGWHIVQIMKESKEFNEDLKHIKEQGGVDKLLAGEVGREVEDSVGR